MQLKAHHGGCLINASHQGFGRSEILSAHWGTRGEGERDKGESSLLAWGPGDGHFHI